MSGNTHDDKCLDILITNLHNLYQPPDIVEACQPDDPTKAKPSDHLVPVAYPISGESGAVTRHYQVMKTRPLCESGVREFGSWLTHHDWKDLDVSNHPDEKEQIFLNLLSSKINEIFPEKSVKLSNQDLPFINWKLKDMKRKLQRLYRNQGRRQEYETLLEKYNCEFQKTAKEYIRKNVEELKITNPAKAASILKKLGGAPGDCGDEAGFTILSHQEQNLTASECTARILEYFTNISKEFAPLDVSVLPFRVKVRLLDQCRNIPVIEDYMVYNVIKNAKKPRSAGVPGDLPKKLVKEFPVKLVAPVANLV